MSTLHLLLRALGTCLLIIAGSVAANWLAWVLIVAVTLPVGLAWRQCKRRRNARSS